MAMAQRVFGEVAEWSKANDSKSFEGKPSVGSNPTLSAFTRFQEDLKISPVLQLKGIGRVGELWPAYCTRAQLRRPRQRVISMLENRCLSAIEQSVTLPSKS